MGGRRIPISHAALSETVSPLPFELRQQRIFRYDTARFPFREAVAEVLGVDPGRLPVLHVSGDGDPPGSRTHRRMAMDKWANRWHATKGSPARLRFSALLHRFVAEFCAPRMNECFPAEDNVEVVDNAHMCIDSPPVAYQRDATFRVQVPSGEP